jgi:hypothetical protein
MKDSGIVMKKKSSIFAAVSMPTKLDIYSDMDFLCPFDCLYLQRYKAVSNPMLAMSYIGRSFVGAKSGGEAAFPLLYTLIFHSTMPTKMKDYSGAKHSNAPVTPAERNTVSIEAFNIEMSAKNRAYAFILSNGLFDRFAEFCKNSRSGNPHRECLEYLLSSLSTK